MSAALATDEQDSLLEIIEVIYGYNSEFHNLKRSFNERTVEVVETALNELIKCNASMKALVVDLIGGAASLTKGWLKFAIKSISYMLKSEGVKFNGLACRNQVAGLYANEIRMSIYF